MRWKEHLSGERLTEQCRNYRTNLEDRRERLVEVERDGFAALSDYDQQLFHNDEERGLWITRHLITNQIAFYENRLLDCPEPVQQITLFAAPAPDAHLEAQYDDRQSGCEDS